MTLTAFATVCGAETKWVQNAAQLLGRRLGYTPTEARLFGLIKRLNSDLSLPLAMADRIATELLGRKSADERLNRVSVALGEFIRVEIDLERYLSDFSARLAHAREHYEPLRRGRKRQGKRGALSQAEKYGIDLTLLEDALSIRPAERIARLSSDVELITAIQRRRG